MADLLTLTFADSVKAENETYINGSDAVLCDSIPLIKQTIPIAATVEAVALPACDKDLVQGIAIVADQDLTLTITLGTGSLTVALKADVMWKWSRTYVASIPNPFAYDIVSCTAANASGVAAVLTIRLGLVAS